MNTIQKNFFKNPSAKTLIIFTVLWFIGIALLILSATDLFSESLFQKKYIMICFLMTSSSLVTIKLYINYYKNKT